MIGAIIITTWGFIWAIGSLFFALGSLATIIYVKYHENKYGRIPG